MLSTVGPVVRMLASGTEGSGFESRIMGSFQSHQSSPSETEVTKRFSDVPSTFNRRRYTDWRCLCPRRYILALMLFILLMIHYWRELNVDLNLFIIIFKEKEDKMQYSIGHWYFEDLRNLRKAAFVADLFAQMPGALLIFIFSSHKFLLISVILSSVLHMFIPAALNHHSVSLVFVVIAHRIISAPTYIAVMSVWKDWAPPAERTKLMTFSLYGIFIGAAAETLYPSYLHLVDTDASYYLSGISGIIWVLFWFILTSKTPQMDPLISEGELIYLENNIPSDNLHKIKVKDIPWKSIIFSMPVLVLCLIWFKVACSKFTLCFSGEVFSFALSYNMGEAKYNPLYFFLPFVSSFTVLIPSSAIFADCLVKKFRGKTLLIRKIFLCGGFFLQFVCLFGTLLPSVSLETIFYMISYTIFGLSIPGFITIALDLSPRYIPVIAGILFTFYKLGYICAIYFISISTVDISEPQTLFWLFLFDGVLSMLCVIFFALWGDAEEQLWSFTFPTNRRANGYIIYPKPEDQDELNLVP